MWTRRRWTGSSGLAKALADRIDSVIAGILGAVLSLPEDDRTMLLATAPAWLDADGSAAEPAAGQAGQAG